MSEGNAQFVIQEHTTGNGVHWDFMLQVADVLWTWRLEKPPAEIGDEPIQAERIFDHDLRFLTYEGPVQNETGTVSISDRGRYRLQDQGDTLIDIQLDGGILSGRFKLWCIEGAVWQLKKHLC